MGLIKRVARRPHNSRYSPAILIRYSAAFEDLTRWMLQQDHRIRPTVVEVMSRVEAILESKSSPSHDPRASVALDFGWQDR